MDRCKRVHIESIKSEKGEEIRGGMARSSPSEGESKRA